MLHLIGISINGYTFTPIWVEDMEPRIGGAKPVGKRLVTRIIRINNKSEVLPQYDRSRNARTYGPQPKPVEGSRLTYVDRGKRRFVEPVRLSNRTALYNRSSFEVVCSKGDCPLYGYRPALYLGIGFQVVGS